MNIKNITDTLVKDLNALRFGPPIAYVYNPLEYARRGYDRYWELYGDPPREVVFIGMNPGPWGMAQTGVPFGEIEAVRHWMGIEASVSTPEKMHPKRPVEGFDCPKSEVSGKRFWGWAGERFGTPENFFSRFFVANYCPLLFLESGGRNMTPDKIATGQRKPLLEVCDRALRETIEHLNPKYVIGVGVFTRKRAEAALADMDVEIGNITHPSPANPRANRGWAAIVEKELADMGIVLPV